MVLFARQYSKIARGNATAINLHVQPGDTYYQISVLTVNADNPKTKLHAGILYRIRI